MSCMNILDHAPNLESCGVLNPEYVGINTVRFYFDTREVYDVYGNLIGYGEMVDGILKIEPLKRQA